MNAPVPSWAGVAARITLGLLLAASGTLKAAAPAEDFSVVIESYQVLPEAAAPTAAAFLPWVEVLAGFALTLGFLTRAAAAAAGLMLASFIAAIGSVKFRGFELPNCGCFGEFIHLSSGQALALDLALLFLAFLAFKSGEKELSLDKWALSGL